MHSPSHAIAARNFFKLQVCNRGIKRLTKEVLERRKEVKSLNSVYSGAKKDKAAGPILKRIKDDLDDADKTLKVTEIALLKAAEEAEVFVKARYQFELQTVVENGNSEETKDEVSNAIRELIDLLSEFVDVCPQYAASVELVSVRRSSTTSQPFSQGSMNGSVVGPVRKGSSGQTELREDELV